MDKIWAKKTHAKNRSKVFMKLEKSVEFIYELSKSERIISKDNRVWNVVGHDYPYTRLKSGGSRTDVWIMSKVKKIRGGYIILEERE